MYIKFSRAARFFENYCFYRKRGFRFREAWHLATMTLPY
jgi:hypothetical protein